jgi:hypothetical protein
MFSHQKDNIFAKSRQRGLSEEEACNLAWFFLMLDDVQLAIVSGEDKYTQNTYNFVKRGIDRLKRSQFYKHIGTNNDDVLRTKYTGAELYARTALTNTQVVSSLSPFFILLEEIGIWKKGFVKEVAEFVRPSLEATSYKTGWIQYIGTGGDVEDGVDDMEYILYNPIEAGVLEFDNIYEESNTKIGGFIPAWKFEVIDKKAPKLFVLTSNKLREEVSKIGLYTRQATKIEINRHKCAFTTDHWTGPNNETYTTLTGHYIDNDWSLCSCVLDFRVFHGSTNGQRVMVDLEEVFNSYNLQEDKIIMVITDTAASMNTFGKYLEDSGIDHGYCHDHNLHRNACLAFEG